jgi:cell division protein FtsQ
VCASSRRSTSSEGLPLSRVDGGLPERGRPRDRSAVEEERRHRLRPWAVAGAVAVALSAGSVTATYTPLFDARTIHVRGERHLERARVLLLAGVGPDTNLIRLDAARAEERLERDPWVADATISTDLPSTLEVRIAERTPAAVVTRGPERVLVASDGTELGRAATHVRLPRVRGPRGGVAPNAEQTAIGARVGASMPGALRRSVRWVTVGPAGIDLELRGGMRVEMGAPAELRDKARALRAVLRYRDREHVALASVDVSVPEAPTGRRAGAPASDPS